MILSRRTCMIRKRGINVTWNLEGKVARGGGTYAEREQVKLPWGWKWGCPAQS